MNKRIISFFASAFLVFGLCLSGCNILASSSSSLETSSSTQDSSSISHSYGSSSDSSSNSSKNDDSSSSIHEHTFASSWEHDETYHWHPSTCGHDVKSNEEEHTFTSVVTDPTYESGGYTTYTCSVCGYSYTDSETSPLSITVTWQNYDGSILEVDEDVPYGSMPSYDGETPRRDGHNHYSYTFIGYSYRPIIS